MPAPIKFVTRVGLLIPSPRPTVSILKLCVFDSFTSVDAIFVVLLCLVVQLLIEEQRSHIDPGQRVKAFDLLSLRGSVPCNVDGGLKSCNEAATGRKGVLARKSRA